jgi:tRNA dimethylallyltransferase
MDYNARMIDLSGLAGTAALVVVVGPTAVGKTSVALRLAARFGGEIVSADSRQVYRHIDIGTAKPTAAEQAAVPHHLIDVVEPDEAFSLAEFQAAANEAIAGIQRRGKLPFLVGGTGLYVKAVTEGLNIPAVPPNPALRAALEREARERGHEWLVAAVAEVDPTVAARERANPRRLIRALEVYRLSGRPLSDQQQATPPPYRQFWIGLTRSRSALYQRADDRVDAMIHAGLAEEVIGLHSSGYGWDLPAMSGLGYRQIGSFLRGECDLATAVQRIKFATHSFVRHQYSWFRLADPRICWLADGEIEGA